MKALTLNRRALSICAVAFALAGCGGSQPPISAPGAMPQTFTRAAHADRGTSATKDGARASSGSSAYLCVTDFDASVTILTYPKGDYVSQIDQT